jgi:hypothetical protein
LEAFGTKRADFSCAELEVMRVASYTNKGAVVTEALVPFGQARPFQGEGAIALEALSETTNGDADSVVMNSACQVAQGRIECSQSIHFSNDPAAPR